MAHSGRDSTSKTPLSLPKLHLALPKLQLGVRSPGNQQGKAELKAGWSEVGAFMVRWKIAFYGDPAAL